MLATFQDWPIYIYMYVCTLDSVDYFILFRWNHFGETWVYIGRVIQQRGVLRVLGAVCQL